VLGREAARERLYQRLEKAARKVLNAVYPLLEDNMKDKLPKLMANLRANHTKHTKAQGLSMSTIVLAVLALVVLVILILIFTGKLGKTGQGIDTTRDQYAGQNCEIPGTPRTCRMSMEECKQQGGTVYSSAVCTTGGVCCSV